MGEPGAPPEEAEAAGLTGGNTVDGPILYTVGHSTRRLDELVDVLRSGGVEQLVDVRSAPGSRRNPQFGREPLSEGLQAAGIGYRHDAALGGFRRPRADSPNRGWQHDGFRGYADHMASDEFKAALTTLEEQGREQRTAVMCAETQWWRCHRRLIADALTVHGWRVLHLGLRAEPVEHELTEFAVVEPDGVLSYPPAQEELV